MISLVQSYRGARRLRQFLRFCLVGGSGVVVDMAVLHLLAVGLGWNVSLSKGCAAETALLSNFLWNEVWTFRAQGFGRGGRAGVLRRLGRFHAICGVGIGLAVALLYLFHAALGINLYGANLLAIGLVTLWNFGINACFMALTREDTVSTGCVTFCDAFPLAGAGPLVKLRS